MGKRKARIPGTGEGKPKRLNRKHQIYSKYFAIFRLVVCERNHVRMRETVVVIIVVFTLDIVTCANLELGRTVNIFTRYGYLAYSMQGHDFIEPTKSIYNHRINTKDTNEGFPITLDISFCETVDQLYETYYKNYKIEELEGWKGFAGQWEHNWKLSASKLGINETYLDQNQQRHYSFVFTRITRTTQRNSIPDGFNFKDDLDGNVRGLLNEISLGNPNNVPKFIRTYGSHYIHSYSLGDSIFQVFVFKKRKFKLLRNIYKTKKNVDYRKYFSPWYAEHIGVIRKASGSSTIEDWMNKKMMQQFYIMRFPSIFQISSRLNVESFRMERRRANSIENMIFADEVLIQLELKSLEKVMTSFVSRIWFREVLHNQLNLWEENK